MIDLVEHANPADLESAGEALQKARDAIAVAARELGDHIDRVDWEGEAGRAFRKWGKNLVKETHRLSDFADTASVQITSAGAGLASVRSSMPPRDTRTDPKAVEDIPTPKRVDGNEAYEAALKSEKDRQEAINQMNRLASFYRVSQHEMAGQEPPTFSVMPDVGVPPELPTVDPISGEPRPVVPPGTVADDVPSAPPRAAEPVTPTSSGSGDTLSSGVDVRGPASSPDRPAGVEPVRTEIDGTGPLPPQTAGPVPTSPPPAPGPTGADGGPPPVLGRGPVRRPPDGPDTRVPRRGGGGKSVLPEQGRTAVGRPKDALGLPGRGPSGPGPGPGPTGRAGPVPPAKGPNGPMTSVPSPMARGISGGTPQPHGLPGPRPAVPGIPGTPRSDGVVGGRPAPAPVAGGPGSRTPQGVGHAGQRGVVGAAPQVPGGRGQMPRRAVGNPDGVVGTPRRRTPAGGGRGNGFTAGGTGLVRGPAGGGRRSEPGEDEATQRPDYLVEEEETHLPGERRHVPPVID